MGAVHLGADVHRCGIVSADRVGHRADGGIASLSKNAMFTGGMGIMFAAVYIVMAIFYIYPALKLWKYANYIGSVMDSGATFDLEMALSQQRSFWKFVGIICLIFVSLYALFFIGGILVAAFGAASSRS
ncbi:MAG: DUF5362 family protein [Verrucomicrobiota bacterium]